MQHKPTQQTAPLLTAAVLMAAMLALGGCTKKDPASDPSSPAAVAASSPDPHAAIVPESANANAAVSGTGPAEGGTAVGGVVAGQDANNGTPRDSGASEPTGGDGATTQTATPPAK